MKRVSALPTGWPVDGLVRREFLGVGMNDVTMAEAVELSLAAIDERVPIQVHQINVHNLLEARRNPELRSIYDAAELVGVDGKGIWFGAQLLGEPFRGTITGVALMEHLIEAANTRGDAVYFLGATEAVVTLAVGRIKERYPDLRVAGLHHGYWTQADETALVESIRASKADILFVGMSTPIKERFLSRYYRALEIPVCVSVGGSFDVFAGVTKRAPLWMQTVGLEWFFRLVQEPRRMWRRYLLGLPVYGALLARELPRRFLRRRKR